MQARAAQQGQAAQLANAGGVSMPPVAAAHLGIANPLAAANRAAMPNQLAVPGQPRPRMPMQAPPNAMGVQGHVPSGLVPPMAPFQQAQLAALQGQHRMAMGNPQADMQLVLQARRISEQQRQAVAAQQQAQQAQQQAQQHPGQMPQANGGNSPQAMRGVNGLNQQSFMANNPAVAALAAVNGTGVMGSPAAAGLSMPGMPAGSPRGHMAQPQFNPQLVAKLNAYEAQLRMQNPALNKEQARQLATQHMTTMMLRQQQHLSQSAMNAAAGVANGGVVIPNGMPSAASPHQYAQMLRAQQQQQQQQQHAASQAVQAAQAAQAAQASQQQRASSGQSAPSAGK